MLMGAAASPVWHGLLPAPALTLMKFPFQAHIQPWVSHMTADFTALLGMIYPQTWPLCVLASAAAWPNLASSQVLLSQVSDKFLCPVWPSLLPPSAICCNLTETSPQVYTVCPQSHILVNGAAQPDVTHLLLQQSDTVA